MQRTQLFRRMNLGIFAAVVGLVAASWVAAPSAHAESKPDDAAHQQLCADLYNIYDTNMDIYYDQTQSLAVRQQAYENAHKALSDYRKQGCKGGAVARLQEVQSMINVQGVASDGSAAGHAGATMNVPRAGQLIQAD